MNTTFARGATALGVAVACAVMLYAANALTPRTAHADPGDNGGFGGYDPSQWDDLMAYLEAIAANEAAAPQAPAPAAVAPPPAAAIEAPAPAAAAAPVATAAASPARVLLPNAGIGNDRTSAPSAAVTAAAAGAALIALGWRRRRAPHR